MEIWIPFLINDTQVFYAPFVQKSKTAMMLIHILYKSDVKGEGRGGEGNPVVYDVPPDYNFILG